MKKLFAIALLPVIVLTGCTAGKKSKMPETKADNPWYLKTYTYSDGSANRYVFNKNSFEYFPVKPEESSTGHYDGGKYVKKQPEPESFYKVVDLIQSAYGAKADHTENREKGTGSIEIKEGTSATSFILMARSTWKQQIEAVLTDIKEKK